MHGFRLECYHFASPHIISQQLFAGSFCGRSQIFDVIVFALVCVHLHQGRILVGLLREGLCAFLAPAEFVQFRNIFKVLLFDGVLSCLIIIDRLPLISLLGHIAFLIV